MKSRIMSMFCAAVTMAAAIMTVAPSNAQEAAASVPVTMTVTASVPSDKRMPELSQQDIAVTQGNERLKVTEWVPAKGDRAGLDLFILIDDASNPTLGMHFDDLKTFINAQPSTTAIGVGYMRNATVQIAQNFTTDHAAAAKALRLPLASVGAYGSPYLSVIDLMKRWPAGENRREVLMVTDGIDRARRSIPWRGLYDGKSWMSMPGCKRIPDRQQAYLGESQFRETRNRNLIGVEPTLVNLQRTDLRVQCRRRHTKPCGGARCAGNPALAFSQCRLDEFSFLRNHL